MVLLTSHVGEKFHLGANPIQVVVLSFLSASKMLHSSFELVQKTPLVRGFFRNWFIQ